MDSGHYEFQLAAVGVFLFTFLCLVVLFVGILYVRNRFENEPEEDEEAGEHQCFIDTSIKSVMDKLSPNKARRDGYIPL